MNEWLAASPNAQIVHGVTGCRISIDDMADRPARALSDGDLLDLGGRRVRFIDTPHVPHGLDAGVIHEEKTRTLFCADLFAHGGNGPALTAGDILTPATATGMDQFTSLAPGTPAILHRLARLAPTTLAAMHGSSFRGDGGAALSGLADHYVTRLQASLRNMTD
jgi:glyoxylase-like metal-dependent hydrolase (beta-lactamase superfamily II)